MSDDYSNQDKDYSKRTKRRGGGPGGGPSGDYKQSRKPQGRDYQGSYDNRGYDKSSKDQYGSNKGSYYNQYDDYDSRPPKNDNYSSYKPKGTHQRRQDPNHGSWKKKAAKIPKETVLETFAKVKPHVEISNWLREYKDLFVREKQAMVNDEVFQLDPNNGLMPKTNRPPASGNAPQNESDSLPENNQNTNASSSNKGFEMFDFGKDRFDPIQAMRAKNLKDDKDTGKPKKGEALEDTLEDTGALESGNVQRGLEDEHEEALEGDNKDLEGDFEEGEYSNIDEMFARKLKNNEIPETYEDAFDDLVAPDKTKEKLKQLEDDDRPEWEDVDTKKVIEDIKKEDFLATLPQDKRAIFGEKIPRPEQKDFSQGKFVEANKNSADKQSAKEFDIDFSKYNFDVDLGSTDDFGLKHEDLFPSGYVKPTGQKPMDPSQAMMGRGMNPGPMPGNYPGMMMQQGNMMRPTPQQLQGMQYAHMQQMPQMPQIPQQNIHPMQQMDYMGMQMRGMGGPDDMNRQQFPYGTQQQQQYMVNQLPAYKRDPTREGMGMNVPRPQAAPTFIFKFFSPVYDEKAWYYIDMQKKVQGPFSGRTMDEWYLNGHLPLTLNVTIGKNNGYKTIKELADIVANPPQAMQGNARGPPPQEGPMQPMGNPQAPPQGYSGISDLLSNRPDLMQYTKPNSEPEKPAAADYSQYAQYIKPGGQNYPEYGHQKGNVPQGHAGDYNQMYGTNPQQKMSLSAHSANSEPQGKIGDVGLQGLHMAKSLSSNPGQQVNVPGPGVMGERPNSEGIKNEGLLQGQQNPKIVSAPADNAAVSPLQGLMPLGGTQAVDMTMQLKSMLGLGGLGGLGGLNIGATNASEPPKKVEVSVPQKEQQVERQPERPQQQVQAQPEKTQAQYQEKQQPQRQEKQNYNQYNYQEKQQQPQQPKKQVVKAPRIDTSDFPSLTETYK